MLPSGVAHARQQRGECSRRTKAASDNQRQIGDRFGCTLPLCVASSRLICAASACTWTISVIAPTFNCASRRAFSLSAIRNRSGCNSETRRP